MNINKLLEVLDIDLMDMQSDATSIAQSWYQGDVKNFHEYTSYNGTAWSTDRKRLSSGMAKVISEKWANLIINPETIVVMGDDKNQEWLDNLFENMNFTNRMNELTELYFALGNGATVQFMEDNGNLGNNYYYANNILPIRQQSGEIVDCAFVNEFKHLGDTLVHVNIHELEDDYYKISNLFFKQLENGAYEPFDFTDEDDEFIVEPVRYTDVKEFQMYKPSIANNINIGSAMGISVFYNAISELKSVDLAFDALASEVDYGKIRIYVSEEALLHDDNGNPIFDKAQTEFYILKQDESITGNNGVPFIKVEAPTLRVESLINALNEALNMLGRKCGLGNQAFSTNNGTIYTNTTQVISTNSDLYNTRQKHCSIMENSIKEMVKSLYYLENEVELDDTISVQFDDSIIHDKERELQELQLQLSLGLISEVYFFQVYNDMTEEEAIDFVKNQNRLKGLLLEEEPPVQENDLEDIEE